MAQACTRRATNKMQQGLTRLAEPTVYNDPGADDNPRVARWVRTQVHVYVEHRRETRQGAPRYEEHSPLELVILALMRDIEFRGESVPAAKVIRCLRKADTEIKIQFLELPNVIRKLVYQWHYAFLDIAGTPALHQQPAISRTNRLVQSEALPIFYNVCTFQMSFESIRRYSDHVKYPRPPVKLSVKSNKLLRSVKPEWLRGIKRIDLNLLVKRRNTTYLDLLFHLRTDSNRFKTSYTITNQLAVPHEEVVLLSPIKQDIEKVLLLSPWQPETDDTDTVVWVGWNRVEMMGLAAHFDKLAVDAGAL